MHTVSGHYVAAGLNGATMDSSGQQGSISGMGSTTLLCNRTLLAQSFSPCGYPRHAICWHALGCLHESGTEEGLAIPHGDAAHDAMAIIGVGYRLATQLEQPRPIPAAQSGIAEQQQHPLQQGPSSMPAEWARMLCCAPCDRDT